MSWLYYLWALTGGAIATSIMIRIWLPRPIPIMRYATVLVAGVFGGIIGGYLVHTGNSDPMPAIVAALAGGAVLSGGVAVFSTDGGKA